MAQQPLIAVIGTGGTIAGCAQRPDDTLHYQAAVLPVQDVLAGLAAPPGFAVEAQQLAQIDSKDVSEAHWRALLQAVQRQLERPWVHGVIVTHGTDTLEESAWLLQTVLQPAKPVLLVGAMRPSTAWLRDGAQNLSDALLLAATPGVRGVLVPCAGQVYAGHEVRKVHPHRLDAFGAGQAGALAALAEGHLQRWRPWPGECWPERWPECGSAAATQPRAASANRQPMLWQRLLAAPAWPRVEWISSHGAQTGALVRALLSQRAQSDGSDEPLRGLVVAGTGNATVHVALAQALRQAVAVGVVVWRCSRTGTCVLAGPDAAQPLEEAGQNSAALGAVLAGTPARPAGEFPVTALPAPQARLALQLHLLAHSPQATP